MTMPSEPESRVDQAVVTATRFTFTPLGRRGYLPEEVDGFLSRVAAELARREEEATALRAEADRYRDALRDWQSRQSLRHNTMADTTPDGARQRPAELRETLDAVTAAEQRLREAREGLAAELARLEPGPPPEWPAGGPAAPQPEPPAV